MPTEKPRRNQQERVDSTRSALMAAGRRLFAEHGYAAVPAEEIVTAAGLTRGALYHHYGGKQGLFLAVFDEMESEMATEVAAAADAPDLTTAIARALTCFLDLCERPEVIRIVLTDAPGVLGWQVWREVEARHGLGLITAIVQTAAADGRIAATSAPVLAQLFLSAMIEAALLIAHADDRVAARSEVEAAVLILVSGLLPPA